MAQRRAEDVRAHRAHRRRPARIRTSSTSRRRDRCGRAAASAASIRRPTAARPGRKASSKSASTPAARDVAHGPAQSGHPARRDAPAAAPLFRHGARRTGKRAVAIDRRGQDVDEGRAADSRRRSRPHRARTTRRAIRASSTRRWKDPRAAAVSTAPTITASTWEKRNSYDQQGQYYSKVQVDPANADRVYIMDVNIMVSDDGGRTLAAAADPQQARRQSRDLGRSVEQQSLPRGLRRRAVRELRPRAPRGSSRPTCRPRSCTTSRSSEDAPFYNVYGGTQDNNSFGCPREDQELGRHPLHRVLRHHGRRRLLFARRPQGPEHHLRQHAERRHGALRQAHRRARRASSRRPRRAIRRCAGTGTRR